VLPDLNRKYDEEGCDDTVFPPLEFVLPKHAISKRNERMVLQSDIVVAYVTYGWGGASKTLEYACRKKNRMIFFPEAL
jgi:hypothetical protein